MSESYFTSDFFAGNRRRLKELFTGTAPIAITANGLLQRLGDSTYSFAQDANFWYLTGIDEPDIILVMDREREYLIVPRRSASREAFDGAVTSEALSRRSGIQEVLDEEAGWELLGGRTKKVRHVATVVAPPMYIEAYGLYTNPARAALRERLMIFNGELELLDLSPHLTRLRMIKQPAELLAIEAAIVITSDSIKAAMQPASIRKAAFEYEIEAELAYGFRKRGATGHAFDPIVASGARACTLHNVANAGALAADELLLMDVGAEVEHYAADITRTYSLGQPTSRQRAVHQAVLDTQRYAFSLLKPGVQIRQYEEQVEQFLGEKLRELNLIKSISHESVRHYCPHAISHFLGLNVHDVGDYERPLEPGMVLTVEPGIYIIDEAIGVRIEDDVLITETGNRNLSNKLSREIA
jgi:Xaa-Pro aminopeptidase